MTVAEIYKEIKAISQEEQKLLLNQMLELVNGQSNAFKACEILRQANGFICPFCGGFAVRNGHLNGNKQRFICKTCHRSFVSSTSTPLARTHKNPDVWGKYMECLIKGESLRRTAMDCGISVSTAFFWRHKVLDALEVVAKGTKVAGIVQMDETFFNDSYKGNHQGKIELPRDSKKRGQPAKKRGLSSEKICIPCAVDSTGQKFAIVANRGKVSADALTAAFDGRILGQTNICCDSEKSYRVLARQTGSILHAIPSASRSINGYNIQRVNALHREINAMYQRTHGMSTKYLNGYLALCCWLNGNRSRPTSELRSELLKVIFGVDIQTTNRNTVMRVAVPLLV